jgi:hypothetical protein
MEDTGYKTVLEARNAVGAVGFSLSDEERLPAGLSLSSSGEISGRPQEIGAAGFTVEALDEAGHRAEKRFSLEIVSNAWSQTEMDGGRSRTNPVASPADGRVGWSTTAMSGATALLTGRDRVFVITSEAAVGLEKSTGAVVYRFPGSFIRYACAGETLYLLDTGGVFHVLDARYGAEMWSREQVRELTTNGTLLVLGTDSGILELDAVSGTVTSMREDSLPVGGLYAWMSETLLQVEGNTIYRLGDAGWAVEWADERDVISDLSCDAKGVVMLTSGGRLVVLDEKLQKTAERDLGFMSGSVALGESKVLVVTSRQSTGFSRAELSPLFSSDWGGSVVAASLEKYFLADGYGLYAINGYDGGLIWKLSGEQKDLAVAGEKVFSLDGSGRVTCFNAPDNVWPPTTTLRAEPAQPNGENGWYTALPRFSLIAKDPETYVSGSFYRIGSSDWKSYAAPVELPEGSNQVVYASQDSTGWRETDKVAGFQVDTGLPETQKKVNGTQGAQGIYTTQVTVELTATDAVSGVDLIQYRIDGGAWQKYTSSISLSDERSYTLGYRAKDIAGNWEAEKSFPLSIDTSIPVVKAHATSEPGLGVVYIEASDTGTGVERIEYRVDGSQAQTYIGPITITSAGSHLVSYRAVDRAGQWSASQSLSVEVKPYVPPTLIEELDFATHEPDRDVVINVQAGERLYGKQGAGDDKDNKIKALPDYLKGANYIRLNRNDWRYEGRDFLSFKAAADLTVSIFKHKKSGADLSGWTLVSRDYPVEPSKYFKGGADIYQKSFSKGERVTIPGTKGRAECWPNLVFAQRRMEQEVRILVPEPGKALAPLSTVKLVGMSLAQSTGTQSRWELRYGDQSWQPVAGETVSLPYTKEKLAFELRLTMSDSQGRYLGQDSRRYQILNQSGVQLINPAPGWRLIAGSQVMVVYRATDMAGGEIPKGRVSWQESRDGKSWAPISLGGGALLTVPVNTGPYYLKASYDESVGGILPAPGGIPPSPGYPAEKVFRFPISAEAKPVKIEMGARHGTEYSLGEVLNEHASGKLYGFSSDHRDRVGEFRVVEEIRRGHGMRYEKREESFIALASGESFQVLVGSGRVKVVLHIGPTERRQAAEVQLNGRPIAIASERYERVVEVTGEVSSASGVLTISGSPDLPLMDLTVTPLASGAPAVADTVSELEMRVIGHGNGWGSDRHSDWDEGEWDARGGLVEWE